MEIETDGAGPPVVLVPGLAVAGYLRPVQRLLVPTCRVHRVTLPGTAGTPAPPHPYGLSEDGEAVGSWLRANVSPAEPAVLVGHSYGAQVAARAAVAAPDRVRVLVLASPTVDPASRSLPRLLLAWWRASRFESPELPRWQRPEQRRAGVRRPWRMVRSMIADALEDQLSLLPAQLPVLVVRGGDDPMATTRWVDQLVDRPHGMRVDVPNASHAFPFDRPEVLAGVVRMALGLVQRRGRMMTSLPMG